MIKRSRNLGIIQQELTKFLEEFDIADAEDTQARTNALISAMIKAGVLKEDWKLKNFRLHIAIERVRLPLTQRAELAVQAELFHDLISSYGGEPDEVDMERARELLDNIADALESAITTAVNRTQGSLPLS